MSAGSADRKLLPRAGGSDPSGNMGQRRGNDVPPGQQCGLMVISRAPPVCPYVLRTAGRRTHGHPIRPGVPGLTQGQG